jgi:murein DD-endopeptidase MepM/ murein hydrolase activator NlpD
VTPRGAPNRAESPKALARSSREVDRFRLQLLAAAFVAVCVGTAPRMLRVEQASAASPTVANTSAGQVPDGNGALAATDAPGSPPRTCPPGTFIDDGACITLPADESFGEDPVGAPEGESVANGHFEKNGKWLAYEQIPRRPDRPADYDAYVYPIPPGLPNGHSVVSGYDLDLPDALQRHGKMRAIGHGGVDLPQKKGTPIKMIALDHQVGDARVIHVGKLFGNSIVTVHTVREGGRTREYVLIFGHLDGYAPGLKPGDAIPTGGLVGYVGDSDSPRLVHLHLEARRVRDGVDGAKLLPGRILVPESTIVCDPRNVLPLKGDPAQPK